MTVLHKAMYLPSLSAGPKHLSWNFQPQYPAGQKDLRSNWELTLKCRSLINLRVLDKYATNTPQNWISDNFLSMAFIMQWQVIEGHPKGLSCTKFKTAMRNVKCNSKVVNWYHATLFIITDTLAFVLLSGLFVELRLLLHVHSIPKQTCDCTSF